MITYYFLGINLLLFLLMGWDKYCAIKNYWRVNENKILVLSFLGGATGTLLGMIIFKHKIKKKKFQLLIPLFILLNFLYKILLSNT